MVSRRGAKAKGSKAERDLLEKFWDTGSWAAHRIAGSGSSRYPSPDILAGNKVRKLAIEVKITKDLKKYFPNEEIGGLLEFSKMFGAEPWVAIKFAREEWYFITPEDLESTEKSFVASLKIAKLKGLTFEEIVR